MTAPMDGALAWDIQKWVQGQPAPTLTVSQVESLAQHLTAKGWGAKHRDVSLGDVKGLLDKGRKMFDDLLGEPAREQPGKPADR